MVHRAMRAAPASQQPARLPEQRNREGRPLYETQVFEGASGRAEVACSAGKASYRELGVMYV